MISQISVFRFTCTRTVKRIKSEIRPILHYQYIPARTISTGTTKYGFSILFRVEFGTVRYENIRHLVQVPTSVSSESITTGTGTVRVTYRTASSTSITGSISNSARLRNSYSYRYS
jgi:hypothetical protein